MINSQLSPHVHTIEHAGGSEDPDSLILGNHDEFHGVQKISSIILVPQNYLTVLQRLSTHAFQPWLLTSLMILIIKPWQSVNNARTGLNRRKQSRQNLIHLEKESYLVM
jgi:hypothetical protein